MIPIQSQLGNGYTIPGCLGSRMGMSMSIWSSRGNQAWVCQSATTTTRVAIWDWTLKRSCEIRNQGGCSYPVKVVQSCRKASVASTIGFGHQLTKCGRRVENLVAKRSMSKDLRCCWSWRIASRLESSRIYPTSGCEIKSPVNSQLNAVLWDRCAIQDITAITPSSIVSMKGILPPPPSCWHMPQL